MKEYRIQPLVDQKEVGYGKVGILRMDINGGIERKNSKMNTLACTRLSYYEMNHQLKDGYLMDVNRGMYYRYKPSAYLDRNVPYMPTELKESLVMEGKRSKQVVYHYDQIGIAGEYMVNVSGADMSVLSLRLMKKEGNDIQLLSSHEHLLKHRIIQAKVVKGLNGYQALGHWRNGMVYSNWMDNMDPTLGIPFSPIPIPPSEGIKCCSPSVYHHHHCRVWLEDGNSVHLDVSRPMAGTKVDRASIYVGESAKGDYDCVPNIWYSYSDRMMQSFDERYCNKNYYIDMVEFGYYKHKIVDVLVIDAILLAILSHETLFIIDRRYLKHPLYKMSLVKPASPLTRMRVIYHSHGHQVIVMDPHQDVFEYMTIPIVRGEVSTLSAKTYGPNLFPNPFRSGFPSLPRCYEAEKMVSGFVSFEGVPTVAMAINRLGDIVKMDCELWDGVDGIAIPKQVECVVREEIHKHAVDRMNEKKASMDSVGLTVGENKAVGSFSVGDHMEALYAGEVHLTESFLVVLERMQFKAFLEQGGRTIEDIMKYIRQESQKNFTDIAGIRWWIWDEYLSYLPSIETQGKVDMVTIVTSIGRMPRVIAIDKKEGETLLVSTAGVRSDRGRIRKGMKLYATYRGEWIEFTAQVNGVNRVRVLRGDDNPPFEEAGEDMVEEMMERMEGVEIDPWLAPESLLSRNLGRHLGGLDRAGESEQRKEAGDPTWEALNGIYHSTFQAGIEELESMWDQS